jgi:hypothetical protein
MYYFYDLPPGVPCRDNSHLGEFLPSDIECVHYDRSAIAVGRAFACIDSDAERHGHEVLVGSRDRLTMATVISAEQQLLNKLFGKGIVQ